jgi:hypothetical protein
MYFTKVLSVAFLFVCLGLSTFGQQCVHVGGGVITNIGVITPNRTLGTATGDLKGAIGVEILSQSSGPGGTTVFSVHHFWVTEAGDTIFVEPALLTAAPVAPGLFAVVTYPVSISGGTGRFEGASGKLKVIGEADFNAGHIGLRYDGEVCFEKEEARGDSSGAASAFSLRNIWLPVKFTRREVTDPSGTLQLEVLARS